MTEQQDDWITQQETEDAKPEKRVFTPGIYEGLSNEEYHRSEPVGSTGLKRMLRSPAHFKYPTPYDATRAKEIGSAIHTAILEPLRFAVDYRIVECDARTSAIYKQACKDWPKERVLTSGEYENVEGMQKGVMRNRQCRELIEAPGRYELSLFAKCPETGLMVKVRYDKILDCGMPVDLKKCQDARPDAFSRAIHNYQYHLSAALYQDAWSWLFGETIDVMRFIACEEKSPHAAARYKLDEESLMIGRALYREALIRYAECVDSGLWPAYDAGDEEQEIGIPFYAKDRNDEVEIDFGGDEE